MNIRFLVLGGVGLLALLAGCAKKEPAPAAPSAVKEEAPVVAKKAEPVPAAPVAPPAPIAPPAPVAPKPLAIEVDWFSSHRNDAGIGHRLGRICFRL